MNIPDIQSLEEFDDCFGDIGTLLSIHDSNRPRNKSCNTHTKEHAFRIMRKIKN